MPNLRSPSRPHPKPTKPLPSFTYSPNKSEDNFFPLSPREIGFLHSPEIPSTTNSSPLTNSNISETLKRLQQHDQQLQINLERLRRQRQELDFSLDNQISSRKSPLKKNTHSDNKSPRIKSTPTSQKINNAPKRETPITERGYAWMHTENEIKNENNLNKKNVKRSPLSQVVHENSNKDTALKDFEIDFQSTAIIETKPQRKRATAPNINNINSPRSQIKNSTYTPDKTIKVKTVDLLDDSNDIVKTPNRLEQRRSSELKDLNISKNSPKASKLDDKAKLLIAMESLKLDLKQLASPNSSAIQREIQSARSFYEHENIKDQKKTPGKRTLNQVNTPLSARDRKDYPLNTSIGKTKANDTTLDEKPSNIFDESKERNTSYLSYIEFKDQLRNKANSIELKRKKIEEEKKKQEEIIKKQQVKERLAKLNKYTRSLFKIGEKGHSKSLKLSQSLDLKKQDEEGRDSWLRVPKVKDEPKVEQPLQRKPPIPHFSIMKRETRKKKKSKTNNQDEKKEKNYQVENNDKSRGYSDHYQSKKQANSSNIKMNSKKTNSSKKLETDYEVISTTSSEYSLGSNNENARRNIFGNNDNKSQPLYNNSQTSLIKSQMKLFDENDINFEVDKLDEKISNEIDNILKKYMSNNDDQETETTQESDNQYKSYNDSSEFDQILIQDNFSKDETSDSDEISLQDLRKNYSKPKSEDVPYKDLISDLEIDEVLSELSDELEAYTIGNNANDISTYSNNSNNIDNTKDQYSSNLTLNNKEKFSKYKEDDPRKILDDLDLSSDDESF